jgi:hypothetical protein
VPREPRSSSCLLLPVARFTQRVTKNTSSSNSMDIKKFLDIEATDDTDDEDGFVSDEDLGMFSVVLRISS